MDIIYRENLCIIFRDTYIHYFLRTIAVFQELNATWELTMKVNYETFLYIFYI